MEIKAVKFRKDGLFYMITEATKDNQIRAKL